MNDHDNQHQINPPQPPGSMTDALRDMIARDDLILFTRNADESVSLQLTDHDWRMLGVLVGVGTLMINRHKRDAVDVMNHATDGNGLKSIFNLIGTAEFAARYVRAAARFVDAEEEVRPEDVENALRNLLAHQPDDGDSRTEGAGS